MKPKTKTRTIEPLEWQEAKELETLINKATDEKLALVVDPDQGVTGTKPPSLMSPLDRVNGQLRFNRHYAD